MEEAIGGRDPVTLPREGLDALVRLLRDRGYDVIAPRVVAGAIEPGAIESADELPIGLGDVQDGGTYRLERRGDEAVFGFASGSSSWKRHLHQSDVKLWGTRRGEDGAWEVEAEPDDPRPMAFLGVRSCDLHAIRSLDTALLEIPNPDPHYARRREPLLVIGLNCGVAGGTCFCASMGTGPKVERGFDLALTELIDDDGHRFLAEVGTERGAELLDALAAARAPGRDVEAAAEVVESTRRSMGRELEADGLKELLYRNLEHPRWDEVSERCLTCGNCTMVCPTCFCTDVQDVTDLDGAAAHHRRWDSCFTMDFSYVHGGSVRSSSRSRYRQWMTHKLASWNDQFDSSGCVGCGRCITWCPVAIDITEEAAAIRATDGARAS
jgi:ferredoxin